MKTPETSSSTPKVAAVWLPCPFVVDSSCVQI